MSDQQPFFFVGNHAALDFVNTLPNHHGVPSERLVAYEDLLQWLGAARMLDDQTIAAAARWRGAEGNAVVAEARRLRASIHALASRLADGDAPLERAVAGEDARESGAAEPDAIETLNQMLASRTVTRQLVAIPDPVTDDQSTATRFEMVTRTPIEQPMDLLAPVAEATADLLVTASPRRVRRCEGHECVLFFYDVSKNGARRWCSMAACGNRRKVARHYQRKRASS